MLPDDIALVEEEVILLELSQDEALVLFEMLSQFSGATALPTSEPATPDPADMRLAQEIAGLLKAQVPLANSTRPDYVAQLQQARQRLNQAANSGTDIPLSDLL